MHIGRHISIVSAHCLLLLAPALLAADEEAAVETKTYTYKKTKEADLEIIVQFPRDAKAGTRRPAIIFFFGGGWTTGTITHFEAQAKHFAERGMVAARADYRVKSKHGVSPDKCVEDAKSAVRWVRENAAMLGVDSERIVAAGGSSGGHIAACTALTDGLEANGENTETSSKPNALVLFNPVLRFTGVEQLMERLGNDEALGRQLSPTLHLRRETPPTLLLLGTADPILEQAQEFSERSKEAGNRVELVTYEGEKHGFFRREPYKTRTLDAADTFLVSLGYLAAK